LAFAFGVMAVSASGAQAAANWLILMSNGEVLTGAQLPATIQGELENNKGALHTKILGLNIEIRCTAGTLIGAELIGEGKVKAGARVQFTGCKTYELGTENLIEEECEPFSPGTAAGTVRTEAGHAVIVLHELTGGVKDELTQIIPDVGTKFAEIEYGPNCVLPEKVPVFGQLFLKDCEGKFLVHQVKHLVEQGPLTSLYVITDTAEHLQTSVVGSAWVFLSGVHSGLSWAGDPA
jgi:hypothetical protein